MANVQAVPVHRTLDQRMAALAVANQTRYRRAAFKRDLIAGADPIPYLEHPPTWLLSMKAQKFLTAIPKIGEVKAKAILRACLASPSKTVGGLGDRQRAAIVGVLRNLRPSQPPTATADASRRPPAPPARRTPLNASERPPV